METLPSYDPHSQGVQPVGSVLSSSNTLIASSLDLKEDRFHELHQTQSTHLLVGGNSPDHRPLPLKLNENRRNASQKGEQGHSAHDLRRCELAFSKNASEQALNKSPCGASDANSPSMLAKPCVIPQTTKAFRGANYSPFIRAYSPELAGFGITQSEFVSFIDGLNEAFIATPILQGLGYAGGILNCVPLLSAQVAGGGIQLATGLGAAALSYARTRSYVKAANKDRFHPLGLEVRVLTTKKMMEKLGVTPEEAHLPGLRRPLETIDELNQEIVGPNSENGTLGVAEARNMDPRMARLKALEGHVAPLDIDNLPPPVDPENVLRRMGAKFCTRQERRHNKRTDKKRQKAQEKEDEKLEEAAKEKYKADMEIAKIERNFAKVQVKAAAKMEKKGDDPSKRMKIESRLDKRIRRLDKEMTKAETEKDKKVGEKLRDGDKEWEKLEKKEQNIMRKIRWIVVGRKGDTDSEDNNVDDSSEEQSAESLNSRD